MRSLARGERPEASPAARPAGRAPNLAAVAGAVREELGEEWPPRVYGERVRTLRTRSHALPAAAKNARVEIQHTLLGVELKVGRRRVSCPDLSTARYLAFFARAGCAEVAVPYDITKISHLADRLEQGFERALLYAERAAAGRPDTFRKRLRRFIVEEVRRGIEAAGAGAAVPQFRQSTRQRTPPGV
ncbi:MAG: hypothetical protein LC800_14450 [Acidobacteria bacterium]|nr:hypothetical protein [Acidobacteriota bacterium]